MKTSSDLQYADWRTSDNLPDLSTAKEDAQDLASCVLADVRGRTDCPPPPFLFVPPLIRLFDQR